MTPLKRVWIPLAVVMLSYFVVILRLAHLQIFLHRPLSDKTSIEVTGRERVRPLRGRLLDHQGRVLATTLERPSIFVNLRETNVSPRQLARALAGALPGLRASDFERRFARASNFVWIKRLSGDREVLAVRRLGLSGVGFFPEPQREYPAQAADELLGRVNIDGDGSSGLEAKLNPLLQGRSEIRLVLKDALGKVFAEREAPSGKFRMKAGADGETGPFDVWLTIDGELQSRTQEHLDQARRTQEAMAGAAIVMEVPTGAILAMASKTQSWAKTSRRVGIDPNLAASFTYEPGSVIKPFVIAAALANGVARESDTFDCEGGKYRPKPYLTIEDHEPYDILALGQVLAYSSNIGMAKIGQLVGAQPFYSALRSFGFGSKTGLPVTGEAVGIVRSPEEWSGMSLTMMSFGYEIGVTPLQLTGAVAALGHDGVLLEPQIVARISPWRGDRALYQMTVRKVRRAVDAQVARRTVRMMREVMEYGTGKAGQIPGYPIAGKTGTAQKIDSATGKHSTQHVVVTFCGLLPAPVPELAICVLIDDARKPKVAWASDLAVPLFKKIAQEAIVILGIPPTESAQAGG